MHDLPAEAQVATGPAVAPPAYLDARRVLAARFLFGEGLEVGALHQPLALPKNARARYVDRMQLDDLRREYPELEELELTPVDVVDDGELLNTIPAASQDFIVANHFLEHCEDPIRTIETHLGKLRPGGVLFYSVPDKRFTFDFRRQVTPLEHMIADHEEGPARSRREHYDDWVRRVEPQEDQGDEELAAHARDIEAKGYSIHMHVWTQAEFLQLVFYCRERFEESFDLEAAARQGLEFTVVLRKQGPLPPPNPVKRSPLRAIGAKLRGRVRRLRSQRAG
jgi:SAM-dependent methyltransferase